MTVPCGVCSDFCGVACPCRCHQDAPVGSDRAADEGERQAILFELADVYTVDTDQVALIALVRRARALRVGGHRA